jgi:hypothetical protein
MEMSRLQEVRHAIERVVVDQDRAEQRLLRVDVVGLDPVLANGGFEPGDESIGGHRLDRSNR